MIIDLLSKHLETVALEPCLDTSPSNMCFGIDIIKYILRTNLKKRLIGSFGFGLVVCSNLLMFDSFTIPILLNIILKAKNDFLLLNSKKYRDMGPDTKPLLVHFWKLQCSPRLKYIFWQIIFGCLPVYMNLHSRGTKCDM